MIGIYQHGACHNFDLIPQMRWCGGNPSLLILITDFNFLYTYCSNYWKADHSTEIVIGYEPATIGYCPKHTRNKP